MRHRRIFYDCEFIDDGKTIDLISIGMVDDDGDALYAVSSEFDLAGALAIPWLAANVAPSLPLTRQVDPPGEWQIDLRSPVVKPRSTIRNLVTDFITRSGPVELWADYGAYDHVALAQLFGAMVDLPHGVPMWTHDLRQRLELFDATTVLPEQETGHHNAIADARHLRRCAHYLDQVPLDTLGVLKEATPGVRSFPDTSWANIEELRHANPGSARDGR